MRVLIADHDAMRSKTLNEACLARGHVVERATQGAAALELALERVPDAVICPIDLAVIDGERLAGMISIGDVVKAQLEAIEFEYRYLRDYIQHG